MIHEVDDRLTAWVNEVLGDTPVLLDPSEVGETGVSLWLFGVENLPPARGTQRPPLQALLRYLVSVTGDDPHDSHRRLGELLFGAMQRTGFEDIEISRVPLELWTALGVAPRAGFVLKVPLRKPVEVSPASPVTKPLKLSGAPIADLDGVILGPGDVPIADAFVEIPALGLTTRSDPWGRFRFPAVAKPGHAHELCVRAKSREFAFPIDSDDQAGPVALRLDLAKE